MEKKRAAGVVALMAAVFVGGVASAAYARSGNGPIWVGNTYAHIDGSVYWYPQGTNHGGMRVYGNLYDDEADSNSVKVNGRVAGYSYTILWTNSNGNGSYVYGDKVVYDPQATISYSGDVQTCRYNAC